MSSPIALQELFKAGFEDFVIPSYETAPYTTIQNRAKVTRSLKAIAGVERVHVKGLNRLENEFGPNGEQVFEAENKDNRIRFVGGWVARSTDYGAYAYSVTSNDFLEVTFYGTGLNLVFAYIANTSIDIRSTVDGGVEGSDLITATYSNILGARNYGANIVLPIVSGLTLGWHTVKIRSNAAVEFDPSGFEILNERSNLAVYAGAGISNGSFNGLSSLATSAFNQGVVGTRGARVVKYIENGTLKSAVQEVDSAAKYLSLADHTNEEVVRRINYREFGANRADDFSTLPTTVSDRAFTLDDGTTTLLGDDVRDGSFDSAAFPNGGVYINSTGTAMYLTFVGTGLDLVCTFGTTSETITMSVDGASVGTMTFDTSKKSVIKKVASGLPYGTHIVKMVRGGGGASFLSTEDFIIYQPKKPSIPAGAIEVADYNLLADVSAAGATDIANGQGIISGMIWKSCMREFVYSGTWAVGGIAPYQPKNGFITSSNTSGNYIEYTFFGSSIAIEFNGASANTTCSVQIDGVLNASGVAYGTGVSNAGAGTYNLLTPDAATGGIVLFTGLSLAKHTVRITKTAAAGSLDFNGVFVGSQIHINNPTLKVGSQSLKSVTKYSPEKSVSNAGPDLSKAKAWLIFDGGNNRIIASYNISAVVALNVENYRFWFEKPFKRNPVSIVGISQSYTPYIRVFGDTAGSPCGAFGGQVGLANTVSPVVSYLVFFGELIDE